MCGKLLFKSVKFLLLLLIGWALFDQIQGRNIQQSREVQGENAKMRVCGQRILATLRLFCAGLKNGQQRGKRSLSQLTWKQVQNAQPQNQIYDGAYNMLNDQPQTEPSGSRNQGIVGECCYNSERGCNATQLKRYCDIHLERGVTNKRPYIPTTTTTPTPPKQEQSSWLPWLAFFLNGLKKPETGSSVVIIAETESADNTPPKVRTPEFGVPSFVPSPPREEVEVIIEETDDTNNKVWTPTFGRPSFGQPSFGGNQNSDYYPSLPISITDAPIIPEIGSHFGLNDGIQFNVKKK